MSVLHQFATAPLFSTILFGADPSQISGPAEYFQFVYSILTAPRKICTPSVVSRKAAPRHFQSVDRQGGGGRPQLNLGRPCRSHHACAFSSPLFTARENSSWRSIQSLSVDLSMSARATREIAHDGFCPCDRGREGGTGERGMLL